MLQQYSFGGWLKRSRKALDLTQAGLARQVSCSAAAIRKIEAEERRPSAQIVERLAEIFNIPQDERTTFLRFARGDWRAAPTGTNEDSPWRATTKSIRSNLPATTTSLIGREQETALVRRYLLNPDIRLVTLIGPPGIGKTRLSLEAARELLKDFPYGVFFVALASLDNPSLIAPAIVQALGYVEPKNQPAKQQLMDGIGEKQMLIVLDNCEHLIEDVAPLVSDLLSACPRLKILSTSRESLRVSGEWLHPVPPLDVPQKSSSIDAKTASKFPAMTLFAERARAVRSDFTLNVENIQAVASICAQLDGLPLAIELIAARMRLISPLALLEHLNDQFVLSANGMRAVPERQKTLNNAIGWSYNLLPPEEQKILTYLSVFSGGFTLEAAESIFSGMFTSKSVSDLISSLFDKNLLQRTSDAQGRVRFNMLVTIRSFASQRRNESGQEGALRDQHAAYFINLAEEADKYVHGPNQPKWMDRLDTELDNFRAALDWCLSSRHTEKLLRLFTALNWTWLLRWSPSEARSWLDKIRVLPDIADYPEAYAQVLNTAVRRESLAANLDLARSLLEESQAIWLELGANGERGLAEALSLWGMIAHSSEGDINVAASYFEQSFELYQKCGDKWGMALARFSSGCVAYDANNDASALAWLNQSLDLFRQLGDSWGMARTSQFLGQLFLKQGSYEKARLYFEQHLNFDDGFKEGTVLALSNLGDLYRYQRDYDHAEQYYEKSLSMCREFGLKIDGGYNLYALGMLALHRNNYSLAMQLFTDYFNSAQGPLKKSNAIDFLIGSAAVAGGTNQSERAAKLQGAAFTLFETTDYRIPPFDRAEFDRHIQIAREQLADVMFEALSAEGRAMTMEQAVAYALQKIDE